MRPIVTVLGLRRNEYMDPDIAARENAVKAAWEEMSPDFGTSPEIRNINPIFYFPFDPSVTTKKVPLTIIVEVFDPCPMEKEDRDEFAERIAKNFRLIPGNKGRKIEVIVRRSHESDGGYYSGCE